MPLEKIDDDRNLSYKNKGKDQISPEKKDYKVIKSITKNGEHRITPRQTHVGDGKIFKKPFTEI